jgi:hypothetical protein
VNVFPTTFWKNNAKGIYHFENLCAGYNIGKNKECMWPGIGVSELPVSCPGV